MNGAVGLELEAAGCFDPVMHWAAVQPDRVALITEDEAGRAREYRYADLHRSAERCRERLAASGVVRGSRVALLARNRADSVTLFIACIRLGAILVPLNWRLAPPELARILAHAEPAVLVGEPGLRAQADAAYHSTLGEGPPRAPWLDLDVATAPTPLADTPSGCARPHHRAHADEVVMLLYTSGSTGEPKGVLIPHRQLYWNAVSTVAGWELTADDVALVMTPLFHTAGWHVFLTPLLWCGGRVVLPAVFEPDRCLAALERYSVTVTFVVPTQLDMLQRAERWGTPLPMLRTIISGGAPCPVRVLAEVRRAGYPVRDAYGLTECGPNCFVATDEQARARPGSVGWPLPGLETRVVDEGGEVLPAGEIGELQLRGRQQCAGYFRSEELTAALITPDGWLRTGDLARIDGHGAHWLCGRRSDTYISGGEKVAPAEVEAALRACDGVHEVVVVGVPDPLWGEVGVAIIEAAGANPDLRALEQALRQRVAGYKVPHAMHVVTALPRLGSGKLDRRAARTLAMAWTAGAEPG